MIPISYFKLRLAVCLLAWFVFVPGYAHHILGRPSYNLNEDSNTPSSNYLEVQIGDYIINYMVYPAYPKPNELGRINFYATGIDSNRSYNGTVSFSVQKDSWFASKAKVLGTQYQDDHIFHQGFMLESEGNYIVNAVFHDNNQTYSVDLPIQVGTPETLSSRFGIVAASIVIVILLTSIVKRKKLRQIRTKRYHA